MKFEIGLKTITSYKRLSYSPSHAIAEFVDNSTQSFFNNESILRSQSLTDEKPLVVKIEYRRRTEDFSGLLRITDNAMGMSEEELERAMQVATPPDNVTGRSRYGMGMKTAAGWMGNVWTIWTKKLGEDTEYSVQVDVNKIAAGNNDLKVMKSSNRDLDEHYTIIEISDHNQRFYGRQISSIKEYLSSMYRQDFRKNILSLFWGDELIDWQDFDDDLLLALGTGQVYKKDFAFDITTDFGEIKHVNGWVGVLKEGSRAKAGFTILHSGRVIQGYPDSWRPSSLYGQLQGSNDLVNQRLIGEVHLDDFEVSHTKDHIVWLGNEEELVLDGLKENCWDYREIARTYRKSRDDQRGPTEVQVASAISSLEAELNSAQLAYWSTSEKLLTDEIITEAVEGYVSSVVNRIPETFKANIVDTLLVRGYVEEMSPNDPYLAIHRPVPNEIIIVVNKSHPHWNQLRGSVGVLNFLRHCVYDGIAEAKAQDQKSLSMKIFPDTIKILKDDLLRIPFDIEQAESDEGEDESD